MRNEIMNYGCNVWYLFTFNESHILLFNKKIINEKHIISKYF